MRFLFTIMLLHVTFVLLHAQPAEPKLYYFVSKDSLVGVKNAKGQIIIPALHMQLYEDREPVPPGLIYLMPAHRDSAEPHSWGLAYDRKGNLLFSPFFFDNGPDEISEGMMRYVKNKKVGFVNREGKVVIKAKYDFVEQFNYGIAQYCNGCVWQKDGEHSFITGGKRGYINFRGEELMLLTKRVSSKDQIIDSLKYIPYQFRYSPFEQKIIDSFSKLSMISKAYFVNRYPKLKDNEKLLHYEIVERPSSFYPYYHVKAFEFSSSSGYHGDDMLDLNFFVTKDGRNYFAFDYGGKKIPLNKWLEKHIREAREYLKNHSDAPNKF